MSATSTEDLRYPIGKFTLPASPAADEVATWRKDFAESAAGQAFIAHAPADVRSAAERLLGELLAAVPSEPDWDDVNSERFEGAVEDKLLDELGGLEEGKALAGILGEFLVQVP